MRRIILFLSVSLLMLSCLVPANEAGAVYVKGMAVPGFVGFVPDEIVVKFDRPTINALNRATAPHGLTGISILDKLRPKHDVISILPEFSGAKPAIHKGRVIDLSGWHKIKFGRAVHIDAVIGDYKAVPGVIDAQPIGIHTTLTTPNDTYFSQQWHMNQGTDHDIDAPEAWDTETGNPDIIVAVLDTGVRYFHRDLGGSNASSLNPTNADGNMWINWAEKNGTAGADDDGNGKVDDWIGWDWVDGVTDCYQGEDCSGEDNDPRDFNGHGTHCAGNVAAINNNGYGTTSPAGGWGSGTQQPSANGVKVMALRVGWSGVSIIWEVGYIRMDFAAQALCYAADKGARIASCSWGSSNTGGIGDAIDYFLSKGGIIFKAAGNDNNETADYMCGREIGGNDDYIISVAATNESDCKASFSCYGTWVDVSAPGAHTSGTLGILSLYHDHYNPSNDCTAHMDGTSMAAPLAASVAALIWSRNPSWTAYQVRQGLYESADAIDSLSCNSSYAGKLGKGRINAHNAMNICDVAADFSGTPVSGCAPLTVNFTDGSYGPVLSWQWFFGDGGTSTAMNPTYRYTSAGTYTVSLTVSSTFCSDTKTRTGYITVKDLPPAAGFTGSPTGGAAPLTVNFTDTSTGAESWQWDFGDSGTSPDRNPSHTYANAGTYNVSLTAGNPCGSDHETKAGYITVTEPPVQQCDDFGDGDISNWGNKLGTWSVANGSMKGNSTTAYARITSPFGSFTGATIDVDVRVNLGQSSRKVRIVFAYVDGNNYRFVEGDDVYEKWRICERVNGTEYKRSEVSKSIIAGEWYHAKVEAKGDGNVVLSINGAQTSSYKFTSAAQGLVGCGYHISNCDFDNFCAR